MLSCSSTQVFWAIGSTFTVAVAMAVMPTLGWRWLLGILSLPLLIFLFMSKVSSYNNFDNLEPRACDPFGLRQGTRDSGETDFFKSDFTLPVLVLCMTLGMESL